VSPSELNITPAVGEFYGLLDFHEEGVTRHEAAVESDPERADTFHVQAGKVLDGVDVVTNRTIDVNDLGPFQFLTVAALETPSGSIPTPYLAVRVPAERFAEVTRGAGVSILAGLFLTAPSDPSVVPRFPEAMLTTWTVLPDGTASVDLEHPLARVRNFVGRDIERTPFCPGVGRNG
jgi:hypothetical protein